MEKKKPRFGQAVVTDSVTVISQNHNLDAFQLLQLQWSVETFTLSRPSDYHANTNRRGRKANLKLVEFCIVEQSVFIGIAKLEYSTERFYACWLERLTSKVRQMLRRARGIERLRTCFFESYRGAVGWRTAFWAK